MLVGAAVDVAARLDAGDDAGGGRHVLPAEREAVGVDPRSGARQRAEAQRPQAFREGRIAHAQHREVAVVARRLDGRDVRVRLVRPPHEHLARIGDHVAVRDDAAALDQEAAARHPAHRLLLPRLRPVVARAEHLDVDDGSRDAVRVGGDLRGGRRGERGRRRQQQQCERRSCAHPRLSAAASPATGIAPVRVPAGAGLVGACARNRQIINVPDCYADPRFDPGRRQGVGLPHALHADAAAGRPQGRPGRRDAGAQQGGTASSTTTTRCSPRRWPRSARSRCSGCA